MDSVERVITNLKSQKDHVRAECEAGVQRLKLHIDPGGKRAMEKTRERRDGRIEVIDYVLNILENPEEEPCPD